MGGSALQQAKRNVLFVSDRPLGPGPIPVSRAEHEGASTEMTARLLVEGRPDYYVQTMSPSYINDAPFYFPGGWQEGQPYLRRVNLLHVQDPSKATPTMDPDVRAPIFDQKMPRHRLEAEKAGRQASASEIRATLEAQRARADLAAIEAGVRDFDAVVIAGLGMSAASMASYLTNLRAAVLITLDRYPAPYNPLGSFIRSLMTPEQPFLLGPEVNRWSLEWAAGGVENRGPEYFRSVHTFEMPHDLAQGEQGILPRIIEEELNWRVPMAVPSEAPSDWEAVEKTWLQIPSVSSAFEDLASKTPNLKAVVKNFSRFWLTLSRVLGNPAYYTTFQNALESIGEAAGSPIEYAYTLPTPGHPLGFEHPRRTDHVIAALAGQEVERVSNTLDGVSELAADDRMVRQAMALGMSGHMDQAMELLDGSFLSATTGLMGFIVIPKLHSSPF